MSKAAFFPLALAVALAVPLLAQSPPPAACTDAGDVQFVCGLQAPEDLVVVPGGEWVVASAYSGTGGLYLIRTSTKAATRVYPADGALERLDATTYNSCPGPPDAATKAKFQTHGLHLLEGANGVHRLFVVLHGGRESVEVYELDTRQQTPRLTWIGCAVAPDPIGLNSVRGYPDGGFAATNFLPRDGNPAGMKTMMGGAKNGELWEWHTPTGWQKVPGSEASGANGLEISEDGRWYYVAAWGSQSFFRLARGPHDPQRDEIPLGFRVDNIRWAGDGTLLATGQAGVGGVMAQLETVIVKIDPEAMNVREVLRRPAMEAFTAGTVAVEVGRTWWVGSYRGDRLAIFPIP